ncbi:MAG: DUF896 domain-containing protein [Lachnospiraceae bacterium]|nr:DUF896 domain-containing protein [Lachnospiraceae bacterium]
MDMADIARINELYKKMKETGLTPEEKEEQARLRGEYIQAVRRNMRCQLESIKIQNPDGSLTDVKERHDKKYGRGGKKPQA